MKKTLKTVLAGLLSLGSAVCAAQNLTVCTMASYTIASMEGVSGATYQWTVNGAAIPNATGAAYTNTTGLDVPGTYAYVRRAYTADCGWQNSNAFMVYVVGPAAPEITAPADGCVGDTYVFTVPLISGATYSWVNYTGGSASANSYTYASATAGTKGAQVYMKVSAAGTVCSSSRALSLSTVTVYAKPVIGTQPANTYVCSAGTTTKLTVGATPVTAYQWRKSGMATAEGSGYTTATYITSNVSAAGTYSVVVANGACSVSSNNATVTVVGNRIGNSAGSLTVCTNVSYTIASMEGVSGATYQWTVNGAAIPNATAAAYTNTTGLDVPGTYAYVRRAYTADCGWQNSNAFMVYVVGPAAPEITAPADGCVGSSYVFTTPTISGVTHQWVWYSNSGTTATGDSFTYANGSAGPKSVQARASAMGAGTMCYSKWSSAPLRVYDKPVISTHPAAAVICPGGTRGLSVAASPVTAYQWLKYGCATTEGSGYTSASYTTSALRAATTYSVVVANGACSVTSNNANLTIGTPAGATVNFTEFRPCTNAATGATWTLVDTREPNNNQSYKVKMLFDNRIWMVQDLKFGDLCGIAFQGSTTVTTGKVSSSSGTYYGDCSAATTSTTPAGRGYFYDRAATMNYETAYKATTNCPAGAPCRGICPAGWHIPSIDEFNTFKATSVCSGTNNYCWIQDNSFSMMLVRAGYLGQSGTATDTANGYYWTVDVAAAQYGTMFKVTGTTSVGFASEQYKFTGGLVRCLRD
jgi:uncharacterized protein (TIGR02145 family)